MGRVVTPRDVRSLVARICARHGVTVDAVRGKLCDAQGRSPRVRAARSHVVVALRDAGLGYVDIAPVLDVTGETVRQIAVSCAPFRATPNATADRRVARRAALDDLRRRNAEHAARGRAARGCGWVAL